MTQTPTVTTIEQLQEVVDFYLGVPAFAFDVESVGDHRGDPVRNTVTWLSLAAEGRVDVIPMGHCNGEYVRTDRPLLKAGLARRAKGLPPLESDYSKDTKKFVDVFTEPPAQLTRAEVFQALEPVMFGPAIKVGHNLKFDLKSVAKYYKGQHPTGPYFDTLVATFLLDSSLRGRMGLAACLQRELGIEMVKGVGAKVEAHPFDDVAQYSYLDAEGTWALYKVLDSKIQASRLDGVMRLEMDVLDVVCDMELTGVPIDTDALEPLKKRLEEEIDNARAEAYRAAGKVFNLNSNQEKQRLLFAKKIDGGQGLRGLELTDGGKKKFATGQETGIHEYSVSAEALEPYRDKNPLASALLTYADLNKVMSTYIIPYSGGEVVRTTNGKERIEERESMLVEGRIHGEFNQIGTETGRFCVDPETLVEMPRDMALYPDGVPLKDVKVGDLVYTYTWDRRLTLRPVLWVGPTKVAPTVLVTIQDRFGKITTLRCSKDHLVRMWRGEWKSAGMIQTGDRLLGMLQRRYTADGYAYFPPSKKRALPGKTTGGEVLEHRLVYAAANGRETLPSKWDVHHRDHNKVNNAVDNLEQVMHSEHVRMHRRKTSPEEVQAMLDGAPLTVHPKTLRRLAKQYALGPTNHTVIDVQDGPTMQLWDIEVEDTHTFIGADVALHNSSRNPNLQNIPNSRTEMGRMVRDLFVAPEGHTLVVADYSQIEPRVIASFSGDPVMTQTYMDGGDIYMALAEALDIPRHFAKTLILAMSYGIGPSKMAAQLDISVKDAKEIMHGFDVRFRAVPRYKKQVLAEARGRAPVPYVSTLLGRRRYLPGLRSREDGFKARAERQGFNCVIQGSAADIIKLAMVRAHRMIPEGASLILTVHDEIVTITPDHLVEETTAAIKGAMEGIKVLQVPLIAEVGVGQTWGECK